MNFGSSYIYVPEAADDEAAAHAPLSELDDLLSSIDAPISGEAAAAPTPAVSGVAPAPAPVAPPAGAAAPAPAPAPKPQRHVRIQQPHRQPAAANSNVLAVKLGTLENVAQVLTGDPLFCVDCRAVYNAESHRTREAKLKDQVRRPGPCYACSSSVLLARRSAGISCLGMRVLREEQCD